MFANRWEPEPRAVTPWTDAVAAYTTPRQSFWRGVFVSEFWRIER